jgi:hypothetical protein
VLVLARLTYLIVHTYKISRKQPSLSDDATYVTQMRTCVGFQEKLSKYYLHIQIIYNYFLDIYWIYTYKKSVFNTILHYNIFFFFVLFNVGSM